MNSCHQIIHFNCRTLGFLFFSFNINNANYKIIVKIAKIISSGEQRRIPLETWEINDKLNNYEISSPTRSFLVSLREVNDLKANVLG